MDPPEPGGQYLIPAVTVPINDADAVRHSFVFVADQATLPLARNIIDKRRMAAVVGPESVSCGQRRIDDHFSSTAVDVGKPQAVRCGQPVDLPFLPKATNVSIRLEDGHDAGTVL